MRFHVTAGLALWASLSVQPADATRSWAIARSSREGEPSLSFFGRVRPQFAEDAFGRPGWIARLPWSGSAVVARFRGPELRAAIESSAAGLVLIAVVDGREAVRFETRKGRSEIAIKRGLSVGPHEALLMRETEAAQGTIDFLGFDFGRSGRLLAPRRVLRGPRIEFIGDSITCGYGNLATNCRYSPRTQSAWESYPQALARLIHAPPPAQVCVSGIGIVRNFGAAEESDVERYGPTMPRVYQWAEGPVDRHSKPWDFDGEGGERPDVVVVNLGTNDAWSGEVPERFETTYREFLEGVRQRRPLARIVATLGPMDHRAWPAVEAAARAMREAGDARISSFRFPLQDPANGVGCDWHPSSKTHRAMAEALRDELRRLGVVSN